MKSRRPPISQKPAAVSRILIGRRSKPFSNSSGQAATLPGLGGFVLLYFVPELGAWLRDQGTAGVGFFIAGFAILAGLALLPTYAQAALAGWTFGLAGGGTAAMCGIALAATIGYLVARLASGDRVVHLINDQPKWKAVYDALLGSGPIKTLLIVTLLRVPPNSPFAITNLVMASCRIRPMTYLIGTVVGIAPRTMALVWLGAQGADSDFAVPRERWMYIATVVTMIIVIAIVGLLAKQAIAKVTAENGNASLPKENAN